MSEYFDDPSIDYDDDPFYTPDEDIECRFCGMSGLHWEDFGSGWKLYDSNDKGHVCPSQKPSADDFEVLP